MIDVEHKPGDPLLDALEQLREIDADYVASHPDTVRDELDSRMLRVCAVVIAIDELGQRDENATPEAVACVVMRFHGAPFVAAPEFLRELATEFLRRGDHLNGGTLARVFEWAQGPDSAWTHNRNKFATRSASV